MIRIVKSSDLKPETTFVKQATSEDIISAVNKILEDVRLHGDEAVRKYTAQFDGCQPDVFEIPRGAIEKAASTIDPEFIKVMERAAASIEDYHRNQLCTGFDLLPKNGVILGQKVTPLARVGCYIPGGTAAYPSSVLMNVIPAKLAGVKEIILATPPATGAKGKTGNEGNNEVNGADPSILAAAKIAGVDRVFTIGGAQAIAALAYGTQSIPRVDKITGPGNAYVTEAKRQVYGIVGIDMLAGPSDILIIADRNTSAKVAAADMLSQCEHGEDSKAILITDSPNLAKKIRTEIKEQLEKLPRREIAERAIDNNSMIIEAATMEEVFDISNRLAPEHLEILLDEPFNYLSRVTNAGSVFLGKHTPETLGDYIAGPNHTLPTNGTARFSSPLTVDDFIKKTSYTYFSEEALSERGGDAVRFAREEGLEAHALAVEKRIKKKQRII